LVQNLNQSRFGALAGWLAVAGWPPVTAWLAGRGCLAGWLAAWLWLDQQKIEIPYFFQPKCSVTPTAVFKKYCFA